MRTTDTASMIDHMEIKRRTWTAAVKLAVVVSLLAASVAALAWTQVNDLPQAAIVIPVMVIAFAASWVQTERIHRRAIDEMTLAPARSATRTG